MNGEVDLGNKGTSGKYEVKSKGAVGRPAGMSQPRGLDLILQKTGGEQ